MRKITKESIEWKTGCTTFDRGQRWLAFKFDAQFVYVRTRGHTWKRMGYEALYVRCNGIEAGFEPVATGKKKGGRG